MAVNETTHETMHWEPDTGEVEVGHLTVWTTLVGGLVMWGVHLGGISILTPIACDRGNPWMWSIHGLTILTGVATAGFIGLSWSVWRLGRPAQAERTRLLGVAGLFLNTISLLLILGEEVPAIFMDPCAR